MKIWKNQNSLKFVRFCIVSSKKLSWKVQNTKEISKFHCKSSADLQKSADLTSDAFRGLAPRYVGLWSPDLVRTISGLFLTELTKDFFFSISNSFFSNHILFKKKDLGRRLTVFYEIRESAHVMTIWRTFLEPAAEPETTKNDFSKKTSQICSGFKNELRTPKTHRERSTNAQQANPTCNLQISQNLQIRL